MTPRTWLLLLTTALAAHAQQIRVAPHYLGQPLAAANANYKLFYYVGSATSGSLGSEISPAIPNPTRSFIPGVNDQFNLRRAQDGGDPGPAFASTILQYPQSGVLDWNPETGAHYGILKGSVRIDGNIPVPGTTRIRQELLHPYGLELSTNIDASGNFRILLWATTYTFTIRYNNNTVHTASFTVQPGQEVDTGTILAPSSLANGTLRTEPTYLGQPVSTLNADFAMQYWRDGSFRNDNFSRSRPALTESLAPISYAVDARVASVVMGTANATVVGNTTVNANPEVGGAMGLVQGTVTVNGAVPTNATVYTATNTAGVSTNLSNSAGAFRWLLRAGGYTASIFSTAGTFHTFPFTVVAGQTTNLGTIAATELIGTLVVNPVYQGQPISTLGAGFSFRTRVNGGPTGGNLTPAAPTWTGNLLAGTYTVEVNQGPSNNNLHTGTVTVVPNAVTQHQPELSGVTGLFRGGLRIEGNPPTTSYGIQVGSVVFPVTLATGDFRGLIWGGTHSPSVGGASSFSVGTRVIPNGVETDLGLLGLLLFNATVTQGGGTVGGVRTWNFKLTNMGPAAVNTQITAINVMNLTGAPCVEPVRQTALPVAFGSIPAGGNATQGIAFNFMGSASSCRYNIQFTVTDGGVRQQGLARNNLWQ